MPHPSLAACRLAATLRQSCQLALVAAKTFLTHHIVKGLQTDRAVGTTTRVWSFSRQHPLKSPFGGLQTNIALIAAFNYYYTFLQLEPKDLAEQLKRSGASIPAIRPGPLWL